MAGCRSGAALVVGCHPGAALMAGVLWWVVGVGRVVGAIRWLLLGLLGWLGLSITSRFVVAVVIIVGNVPLRSRLRLLVISMVLVTILVAVQILGVHVVCLFRFHTVREVSGAELSILLSLRSMDVLSFTKVTSLVPWLTGLWLSVLKLSKLLKITFVDKD